MADYGPAALAVIHSVPALLRAAEAAGAVVLARFLGQALTEAEGIVRRAPTSLAAVVLSREQP